MARNGWPKLLGVGAVLVALSLAMSGCATIAGQLTVQSRHEAQVAKKLAAENKYKPSVGDCWQTSYNGRFDYFTWTTQPPVSCSEKHELYTYAVLKLTHTYTGSEFTSDGNLKSAIDNDSFDVCDGYLANHIGELDRTDERLNDVAFLPRTTEWDLGARWVRCDVSILELGAPVDKPVLLQLPAWAKLKTEIATDPGQFDNCINVPGGATATGPFVKGAVFASCTKPDWLLEGYETFVGSPPVAYPGAAGFASTYQTECAQPYTDATHLTYPVYPTASQWKQGELRFQCWVGTKA